MDDTEFLDYCEAHCQTPRAAFVPAHLARLCRLAGHDELGDRYSSMPNQIMDGYRFTVQSLCSDARKRMKCDE